MIHGKFGLLVILMMLILLASLQACAPAMAPAESETRPQPTLAPAAEEPAVEAPVEEAPAEEIPAPTPAQAMPKPTEVIPVENRLIEMEWPAELHIGESDVIRLALVPTRDGYVAKAEFPEHDLQTEEVPVPRPNGYTLYAIGRLDGIGFDIAPNGDQERFVPEGEEIAWRWTVAPHATGQQRLSIQLRLRWVPAPGSAGTERESLAFGRGINVNVVGFLGLSRSQAALLGVIGMLFGCGFILASAVGKDQQLNRVSKGSQAVTQVSPPARGGPEIDTGSTMTLAPEERDLLRSLFASYTRLVLENEFLSGYSGARTFLARPIRPDGRMDALTIVKLGPQDSIQQEFTNYEDFVKDRLPPVTARIQRPPVTLSARRDTASSRRAALQYTFIAEPGRSPVSLRRALLANPDPGLLQKLFDTFGPNWWMQRSSRIFRLGQEYDGLLPPHYVLEPCPGIRFPSSAVTLDENSDPARISLEAGSLVRIKPFHGVELRADGRSYSLHGISPAGRPALRLRWLDARPLQASQVARVTATRMSLLRQYSAGFERFDLPDPLERLSGLLEESIAGTYSVIHGDLNLENVLVGPGSLVWLIDFAMTREGHPLYDFAHLESEMVAHVLSIQAGSPRAYLDLWRSGSDPLLACLHAIAGRCLHDPANPREYSLALYMACLGALKYPNLPPLAKHCLYLTAADLVARSLAEK